MPVYAEGRVEHQKRTQTATTLWPFRFVFGVQLGLLEKRKRGEPGTRRAASYLQLEMKSKLVLSNFSNNTNSYSRVPARLKFTSIIFLMLQDINC